MTWKSKIKQQFPNPNDYSSFMGDFSTATGAGMCGQQGGGWVGACAGMCSACIAAAAPQIRPSCYPRATQRVLTHHVAATLTMIIICC